MSYQYKRLAMTIYNDVYDEHLFVFAAGLSYYFVLSLFPLLILIASILRYVPIPHLFDSLLGVDGAARTRRRNGPGAEYRV